MTRKTAFVLLIISALVVCAPVSSRAQDYPSPGGYVNDYAGVMSPGVKTELENLLTKVDNATTAEVAIVTVSSVRPLTIERYAVELFGRWGIGKRGKDNGVLILAAIADREVRIEVGYGLEGALTDLESSAIIRNYMVPNFQRGDYDSGLKAAALIVSKIISEEYGVEIDPSLDRVDVSRATQEGSPLGALGTLVLFIVIFGFRFGPMFFLMGRGGGYWSSGSGGSFGGGFGGFGGGFSGGGGASGRW